MKIRTSIYDDFKRLVRDRKAKAVFFSREAFKDTIEEKDSQNVKIPVLKATLVIVAEAMVVVDGKVIDRDTITYVRNLPIFKSDYSEESIKKITKTMDDAEYEIVKDIEEIDPRPLMYSGTIEEQRKQ